VGDEADGEGGDVQVRIELLGPLRLVVGGTPVEVPGPRRRAVLALLAMAGGRVVGTDQLLDALWPAEPPDSGRRTLHSHISRLRGHLGPGAGRLVRDGSGYRLDLRPGELDVAEARTASEPGAALALWRGVALDEFADVAPLVADGVALAELRRDLTDAWLEQRLAAAVAAGTAVDRELVVDTARAAADEPLRDRTHALLVRALAAAGRQAEALRAAHDFRRRLADETGLGPGPDLEAAEQEAAVGVLTPARPAGAATPRARPASPLVGREHELGVLRRRVAEERLVTVVGPGGVGKTRLALEAAAMAAESGRAVTVVELTSVQDEQRIPAALSGALGLRARRDDEVLAAACDALASGNPVLVLDNCEHVVDPVRDVAAALVATCPGLTVLATSREPLGLTAEHLVRLGPLPVPEEGTADVAVPAVEAFLAHARRRQPDLVLSRDDAVLVGDVVRRLDGLPLALELAAGRLGTLSLVDLQARLDRALDLFSAGRRSADARHRSLRDTIDWSYRALDDDEAALLCAIGAFPGGVDLATAERLGARAGIATDPAGAVARLVDTSMLATVDGDGAGRRYRALETVRAFTLDQLDATGRRRHAESELVAWAVDLTAEIDGLTTGPDEPAADARARAELANLGAAWDLAGRHGNLDARVAMLLQVDTFTTYRDLHQLSGWALELVHDPGIERHPRRPEIEGAAARAAWRRGDLDLALQLARAAIDHADEPAAAAPALEARATVALFRGDPVGACEDFLAAGEAHGGARGTMAFGPAALGAAYAGDIPRARALLDRVFAPTGGARAPSHQAFGHYTAAEIEAAAHPDAAAELYGRAIELARRAGASFIEGVASVGLVRLWTAGGRTHQALEGYRALLTSWRRSGHWTQMWTTLRNLAVLLAATGQPEAAARLVAAAEAAPEAAAVTVDAVAAELAEVNERAAAELGPERLAAVRAEAAAQARSEVVDAALVAIDRALG
jgi:predicted ATPase/DNA-binding SARP family transcriptional activator